MAKKNFLLLSMEDDKIKKISNVISNESCRKILDYLSSKDATESELAQKLNIPISTVHYNLQQLMETGLIESSEFHYSEKGKEMSHYRLANKYIIIAPKKTFGIKEKLKSILPVALIASGATLVIQYMYKYFGKVSTPTTQQAMMAKSLVIESATESAGRSLYNDNPSLTYLILQNRFVWFLLGSVCALIIYFIIRHITRQIRRNTKR